MAGGRERGEEDVAGGRKRKKLQEGGGMDVRIGGGSRREGEKGEEGLVGGKGEEGEVTGGRVEKG